MLYGCTDRTAINYYPEASAENANAANCAYIGCTDPSRDNYDPSASVDDGLCSPIFPGCTDSRGLNYNRYYNENDGLCRIAPRHNLRNNPP